MTAPWGSHLHYPVFTIHYSPFTIRIRYSLFYCFAEADGGSADGGLGTGLVLK